eukprot:gene12586-biopygen12946
MIQMLASKVANSGMGTFSERLGKLGKVVTTWDPSAVAPLRTNFMVTVLDAPNRDPLPGLVDTSVIELGAFLPEDSDEILAVLKVQAEDAVCWVALRAYLDGRPDRLSALFSCLEFGALSVHYPLFTEEVQVDSGLDNPEAAVICARAVHASTHPYCVVLLINFAFMDLPAGKMHFLPEHTCLVTQDEAPVAGKVAVLPEGVSSPKTYKQVLASPDAYQWLLSIQEELEALVGVKGALLAMSEEDIPAGCKLLGMSLVLRPKLDKYMQLQKRKSRICAKGNKQEYGVDYHDTFAPCTQLSSVRVVIVLALNLGLTAYHMDVETAFLNSTLEEGLYAGKEWFETSDTFIMSYDRRMQRSEVEPCLYFIRDAGLTVFILAYIDDYVIATGSKEWYDTFVTAFHSKYAYKDLGLALAPSDGKDSSLPYRALLGQLYWGARCTRPDIMVAVSTLSRFCTTYGTEQFVALKQVVRYLKGTLDHEMVPRTASLPGGLWSGVDELPLH